MLTLIIFICNSSSTKKAIKNDERNNENDEADEMEEQICNYTYPHITIHESDSDNDNDARFGLFITIISWVFI